MSKLNLQINNKIAICHIIEAQASTTIKAIMEAFQNSIDSHPKNIYINLFADHFEIRDDGIGISEKCFMKSLTILGNSEKVDDDSIGHFGVGIGQCFNLGLTEIESMKKKFVMDYKSKDNNRSYKWEELIDYNGSIRNIAGQFTDLEEEINGSVLKCQFYRKMNDWKLGDLIANIKNSYMMTSETPFNLFVNGDKIEKRDSSKFISFPEFPTFKAIKEIIKGDCSLYNKGMNIRSIENIGNYSIIGTNFKTILARNDVIRDSYYEKYEELISNLDLIALKNTKNNDIFTHEMIDRIIELFESDKLTLDDIKDKEIFKSFDGKTNYSITTLKQRKVLTYHQIYNKSSAENHEMDRICSNLRNDLGQSYVIIKGYNEFLTKFITLADYDNLKGIEKIIEKIRYGNVEIVSLDELFAVLKYTSKGIKPQIDYIKFSYIANTFIADKCEIDKRKLVIVKDAMYKACTNGNSFINLNITSLKVSTNKAIRMNAFYSIVHSLIHEYSHNSSNEQKDSHGDSFNERSVMNTNRMTNLMDLIMMDVNKFDQYAFDNVIISGFDEIEYQSRGKTQKINKWEF